MRSFAEFIFLIMFIAVVDLNATTTAQKPNTNKNSPVASRQTPVSVGSTTISSTNGTVSPKGSSVQRSPANDASKASENTVATPPTSAPAVGAPSGEEGNTVKGVKKRGATVPQDNQESPASLFDDEKGFLAGLDYPELQVVPKASERLQLEADEEKSSAVGNYWPVQISAIALMLAGTTSAGKYKEDAPTDSQKKENQFASQMGLLMGGIWLGATYYLDHSLSYRRSLPDIRKINGKDKKSLLLKERLSEEALERPAKTAMMINTMSVWSTFVLAVYINEHSKQTLPSYAGLAMGLSFLPWLIDNRVIENWQKHQEYKRKIYAPVTMINFSVDPSTQTLTPLLGMQWRF